MTLEITKDGCLAGSIGVSGELRLPPEVRIITNEIAVLS